MTERYMEHESLWEHSQWRVFEDKLKLKDVKLDLNNPETYRRILWNPYTNQHLIVTERQLFVARQTHQLWQDNGGKTEDYHD